MDVIYTLWTNSRELRIQRYASDSGVRYPLSDASIYSSVAAGFGCFSQDGTEVLHEPPSAPECLNHRVWEVALDLEEIGADPNVFLPTEYVHLGIRVHSEIPDFEDTIPPGFPADFGDTLNIELVTVPAVAGDADSVIQFDEEETDENGDGIINDPLEITQAIQHRDNSLRLVARKDTAVRVFVEVREEDEANHVTVSLYGTRDGRDLPGSPLCVEFWAWPDFEFPLRVFVDPFHDVLRYGIRKGRDNLNHTANFLLPDEWVEPDNVFFYAKARYADQEIESRTVEARFIPRKTPYYIMIPINEGSSSDPVQVDETDLAAAESFAKTIYPVPDIRFERRDFWAFNISPGVVTGEILRMRILEDLIWMYDFMVAFDVEPLPDQMFGYTVTSEYGQAATAGPLCTTPGCGHVSGGDTYIESSSGDFLYNATVMAHEIDHNIGDPDSWGKHVPGGGVGEGTVDPEWVRLYEESEGGAEDPYEEYCIREFGFDTRRPWVNGYDLFEEPFTQRRFTVIPPFWPELMSYRGAMMLDQDIAPTFRYYHPRQWTSPYRWERMFDAFEPDSSGYPGLGRRRMSYHVSGRIDRQGPAELNPVMRLLGRPSTVPDSQGEYALELEYFGGKKRLTVPFTPDFLDSEGEPLNSAYFRFNLPIQWNPTRVLLRKGKEVLDEIVVSKHRPTVKITSPAGNVEWNGLQKLEWQGKDKDDDTLTYAILYNPEGVTYSWSQGKKGWIPLAWGLKEHTYLVNMETLPGGQKGRFRIVATDGFHTVYATSRGRLSVKDKPPTLALVRPDLSPPADDASDDNKNQSRMDKTSELLNLVSLPPGPIVFEAHGSDLEDGPLPDNAFVWFLGQQKQGMGRGKKVTIHFESGVYLITLMAADSTGNTVEKQFSILVGQGASDIS